ncbi:amidohydrolase family protein, partial [Streptomyces flavidovirens]
MPAADLVLTGSRVRTLDPARPEATAVAVKDGLIVAVGGEPDVQDWRGAGTETVDLAGATLTPGLVDSHSHPVWGLEMSTGLDLSAVRDLDAVSGQVAEPGGGHLGAAGVVDTDEQHRGL